MPELKKYSYTYQEEGKEPEEKVFQIMEPTAEENRQHLQDFPIFIGTNDYFATGEGRTLHLIMGRAHDLDEFKTHVVETVGAYFEQGFNYYKNDPPADDDIVWRTMAPEYLKTALAKWLSGENDTGFMQFNQTYYYNFS
jgi:hypothetical protein